MSLYIIYLKKGFVTLRATQVNSDSSFFRFFMMPPVMSHFNVDIQCILCFSSSTTLSTAVRKLVNRIIISGISWLILIFSIIIFSILRLIVRHAWHRRIFHILLLNHPQNLHFSNFGLFVHLNIQDYIQYGCSMLLEIKMFFHMHGNHII